MIINEIFNCCDVVYSVTEHLVSRLIFKVLSKGFIDPFFAKKGKFDTISKGKTSDFD